MGTLDNCRKRPTKFSISTAVNTTASLSQLLVSEWLYLLPTLGVIGVAEHNKDRTEYRIVPIHARVQRPSSLTVCVSKCHDDYSLTERKWPFTRRAGALGDIQDISRGNFAGCLRHSTSTVLTDQRQYRPSFHSFIHPQLLILSIEARPSLLTLTITQQDFDFQSPATYFSEVSWQDRGETDGRTRTIAASCLPTRSINTGCIFPQGIFPHAGIFSAGKRPSLESKMAKTN